MGRWTQYDEDPYRLPEGFTRTAYDADTQVYTFSDGKGTLYQGAPRAEYGILRPIYNKDSACSTRPGAFTSDRRRKPEGQRITPDNAPMTFHDILPSNYIISPSSSGDGSAPPLCASEVSMNSARTSARVKFMEAARKTVLPKMQGVVHSLRRSKTTASSLGHRTSEETKHLLRRGFSTLSRRRSQATTHSGVSV